MMRTQIIQLDGYDDVTSATDKLSGVKAARIVLVWPPKGRLFTDRLDLVRLQRVSRALGCQLALVTRDGKVRSIAREMDIPVYRKVEKAEHEAWRAGRKKSAPWPARRSLAQIEAAYPEWGGLRAMAPYPRARSMRIAIFLAAILAVLGLAAFLLPSARVELVLPSSTQKIHWQGDAALRVSGTGAPANSLPLQTAEMIVEASDGVQTTGTVSLADHPATGTARFTNLTVQAVKIPAGTVVSNAQPGTAIRFVTTSDAATAAEVGQTVDVPIRAVQPGSAGNLPKETLQALEGGLGLQLAVTNPAPTGGGTNRSYPAPSDADRASLKASLFDALRKNALSEAQKQLAPGSLLVETSLTPAEVIADQSFPPDSQPSDRLEQTLRARYTVQYIAADALKQAAKNAMDAATPAGYRPVGESIDVTPTGQPTVSPEGVVSWAVDASRPIQPVIDTAYLGSALRGVPKAQAGAWLAASYHLGEAPSIQMAPSFWPWLPFLSFRIEVVTK